MYGVVSYWVGETGQTLLWLYENEQDAIKAMKNLWEQSYNFALEDDDFNEEMSWHREDFAVVAWKDGLFRYFEVVKQSAEEKIL